MVLEEYGHEEGGCRSLVSIRSTTLLISAGGTFLTALSCVLLLVDSANSAIDQHTSLQRSQTAQLLNVSLSSHEKLARSLAGSITSSQASQILAWFREVADKAVTLRTRASAYAHRVNDTADKTRWLQEFGPAVWAEVHASLTDEGGARNPAVGVFHKDGHYAFIYLLHDYRMLELNLIHNDSLGYRGSPNPRTGDLYWEEPCCDSCFLPWLQPPDYKGYDGACAMPPLMRVQDYPFYVVAFYMVPPGEMRWTNIVSIEGAVGLGLLAPWSDPGDQATSGAVLHGTDIRELQYIVKKSVASTSRGSQLRVFTVVNSDWIYEGTAHLGLGLSNDKGLLTSASHGNAFYEYEEWGANCKPCTRRHPRRDANASDFVIRNIVAAMNSSYADATETTVRTIPREPGSTPEPFYVASVQVLAQGIDWWLVAAIDREYVLGEMDEAFATAQREFQSTSDSVDDQLAKDQLLTFVTVACIVVVVVLAVSAVVFFITKPLALLMSEMVHVSDMDLDSVDRQREVSWFQEVRSMELSFHRMIDNLREYRKYMPESILASSEYGNEPLSAVSAPSGDVALVFTDIRGSTSLWESVTDVMPLVLRQHNQIVRQVCNHFSGYEVKTVGDSFFVVFQSALDACLFGVRVQEALCDSAWPRELAECALPQTRAVLHASGRWIWNGVRVRVGIHKGQCDVQVNPTTGRADYFGPAVNLAARLEGAAVGGFTFVSEDVVNSVNAGDMMQFVPRGVQKFRGIHREVHVYMLLTRRLEWRLPELERDSVNPLARDSKCGSISSSESGHHQPIPRLTREVRPRLRISLRVSLAAVAKVVVSFNWKVDRTVGVSRKVNQCLSCAELAAARTDGLIQHCGGSGFLVTWNAGRRTSAPQESGLAFLLAIHNTALDRGDGSPWCGLAAGPVLHGNLGGYQGDRRYTTVIGEPVQIAEALSALACEHRTCALCAGIDESAMGIFETRPVALWKGPELSSELIVVLEVNVRRASSRVSGSPRGAWGSFTDSFCITDPAAQNSAEQRKDDDTARIVLGNPGEAVRAWWLAGSMRICDTASSLADSSSVWSDRRSSTHSPVFPERGSHCD